MGMYIYIFSSFFFFLKSKIAVYRNLLRNRNLGKKKGLKRVGQVEGNIIKW